MPLDHGPNGIERDEETRKRGRVSFWGRASLWPDSEGGVTSFALDAVGNRTSLSATIDGTADS